MIINRLTRSRVSGIFITYIPPLSIVMPVLLEYRTLDKICIRNEIKGFFNVQ